MCKNLLKYINKQAEKYYLKQIYVLSKKMTFIRISSIILLLFCIGCGSSTQPMGKEPVDKYVILNGTVMDASSARPVVDAVIRFQRMDGAYSVERRTDAEGKFFSLIGYVDSCEAISDFHVEVIKPDYITAELIGGADFQCVDEDQTFIFDLYRKEDYGKENQVVVYGKTVDAISEEAIGGVQVQASMYYEGREECETSPIVLTYSSKDSVNLGLFRLTYTWQWCTRDFYIICDAAGYEQSVINYGLIGSQIGEKYVIVFLYPAEPL